MNEDLAMMAIILTQAKGKEPKKIYKGKPLWHCNLALAEKILKLYPKIFKKQEIKQPSKDDWDCVLSEYIQIFNDGLHSSDRLASLDKMPSYAYQLHISALKGAFEVLNDEE